MVAGRGSRMQGFEGNKTLLPLVPEKSSCEGSRPILLHILSSLPSGPKVLIMNYKKEEVINATRGLGLFYCEQPELNGTGGALIAAKDFLGKQECDQLIITMGDVPFVKKETYRKLIEQLDNHSLMVLGFCPKHKKQYGILEIDKGRVQRIIEWKYWKTYSKEKQEKLNICNAGIYAARKSDLLRYLSILALRPQKVHKEVDGKLLELEEFFITDLVEYMVKGGLSVGYVIAQDETEAIGIDDLSMLEKAQEVFQREEG